MKKNFIFTLLITTIIFFANNAQAVDYRIHGKVYYGGSVSSEVAVDANITIYRYENNDTWVLHGNTWTDECGEYEYLPGESGSYKIVFPATIRDIADIINNCDVIFENKELEGQTYYTSLSIFNKVMQVDIITD